MVLYLLHAFLKKRKKRMVWSTLYTGDVLRPLRAKVWESTEPGPSVLNTSGLTSVTCCTSGATAAFSSSDNTCDEPACKGIDEA